jgi:cation diffusion facilitator CzcD-associated flavoprotein CzcO
MASFHLPPDGITYRSGEDVDVLVIGAGIAGIYQLYRAREAGFSVTLLEAGGGVGGTWYWNRYPGARFDSESYTYGYLFSEKLFEEWQWSEHFAPQPETERYLNHVVDRFDLRRHIRLESKVTAAIFDEPSGTWTVTTSNDRTFRARFLIAATGCLSVPYFPNVPGREHFLGESYHTGLWPATPVAWAGKHVAVIGTGSSGVQLIPEIAGAVASLTVYQRSANWCTPLNNAVISIDEQAELRTNFEAIRETLNTSPSGFLHPMIDRATFDEATDARWARFEALWNSPGFAKQTSNYTDMLFDRAANGEWCAFLAEKIRSIVADPDTAEKLIPKDHPYGGKRPPFVNGYYEVFNQQNVSLIDLRETPILRVTPSGIETAEGERRFDVIVWATGFDFGTGALLSIDIRGRHDLKLADHWADGAKTYLGVQSSGFPNFLFLGGPHQGSTNTPRYLGDLVDFATDALIYVREHGFDTIEVEAIIEDEWTELVESAAKMILYGDESSYFRGANIPGKPRKQLMNFAGRPHIHATMAVNRENGYEAFRLSRSFDGAAIS